MIRNILQQYRKDSVFNRDLGDRFERLMKGYLKLDPKYKALFEDVWLWRDWPQREELGYKLPDTGIDLVARLRNEDGFCAIQCKFYETPIPMGELGNFFTLSGKGGFSQRIIVATAPLSKNAADALDNQTIPVELITLEDLDASPIDWGCFSLEKPEELRKLPLKQPRVHQEEALNNVLRGFENASRGKLIMACGTGKTYTSLIIAERLLKLGQSVLFLVPSIALLSQTLRAWTSDASVPLRCFAVCSDSKASRNDEDMRIYELAYPATTDAKKLANSIVNTEGNSVVTVVFSTYQSIDVVYNAQKQSGLTFDLVICDEAHRTAGYTAAGEDHSAFVRIHDEAYIKAQKRLYMTATPRIYAEASRSRAEENEIKVFSMDDETVFGPVFHRLRFDEAVRKDLLSDYKVLVIAVDELHVSQVLKKRISNNGDELTLDDAVKIVGCWNGLGKHLSSEDDADAGVDPQPMRTAIAFAQSIKHSKHLAAEFEKVSNDLGDQIEYLPSLEARHVDGTMNVVVRNKELSWLKDNIGKDDPVCRILTNARCLSEGVDVPALDAAIFLNPRDSVVDVVQSVGRVMRKDPSGRKKYGYVILPIGIRKDKSPEKALDENNKYRVVWQVLNALRAHDDRLDKQFATIDLNGRGNGVVNVIGVGGDNSKEDSVASQQLGFSFDPEDLGKWKDALYAKIVHKCGNRRYWEDWAKDVAEIAARHRMRISGLLDRPYSKGKKAFDEFLKGIRKNLNPGITQDDAIEMLAQHIITKPVFDALFEGYAFSDSNPVSMSMQKIMDVVEERAFDKENESLQSFYDNVRERVLGVNDPKGRQKIIVELYDKFFRTAFPRMADRLGIVYTPIEVVDFILHSVDQALQEHFGRRLSDEGIHILDPFSGTGTFTVRLVETGIVPTARLSEKYRHELHANEVVLLAYYLSAVNVEEAYHRINGGNYEPFPGVVLTDTFQMNEPESGDLDEGLPANHKRASEQKECDIRVIVGNPPYSVGQESGNDNNQNLKYETLDARIASTYAAHSTAKLKNSLYDSYIRAFRWASDRIKDEGLVCFVTNAGWIDANAMDGFRKTLRDEFSIIYVFNLRGNARTQGDLRQREGGNVFGSGSRTPVAITLLVKKKGCNGRARVYYHDIGDYLSHEKKLGIVNGFVNYKNVPWREVQPNEHNDWIDQRSEDFDGFVPLCDGNDSIFSIRSSGVKTNRDAWVYNFSRPALEANVARMIGFYNAQVDAHAVMCKEAGKEAFRTAVELADANPRMIKWTRELYTDLSRGRRCEFDSDSIRLSLYRPFSKKWIYFNRKLNNCVYKQPKIFPDQGYDNVAIHVSGIGGNSEFSCLVSNSILDVQVLSNGQCFPLRWVSVEAEVGQSMLDFSDGDTGTSTGFVTHQSISDEAHELFCRNLDDKYISKEDIFFYCYGILHSQEYRSRYAADLKKSLPRIPYSKAYRGFIEAGRKLASLHLGYEGIAPWPVKEDVKPRGEEGDFDYYRVDKMRFASLGGAE